MMIKLMTQCYMQDPSGAFKPQTDDYLQSVPGNPQSQPNPQSKPRPGHKPEPKPGPKSKPKLKPQTDDYLQSVPGKPAP